LYVEKCFQKVWCLIRNWRLAKTLQWNNVNLNYRKKWTIIPNGYKLMMRKCSYNSWYVEGKGQQGNFHYTAQNYRETFK
jgi:hypothetical protein